VLQRSQPEVDRLANLLKDIPFFKERKELAHQDIKEIAANLKFEKRKMDKDVITYGDKGNKFYIIIKGVVSVEI
jgi:signal-transduction protein with cAMP-binding, CBS, and nucleotidyltransferase domain